MTPNFAMLVATADAAKSKLTILTAANEAAAQLADAATQQHKDAYAAVQAAAGELQQARAAIDAALDEDYGPAAPMPTDTLTALRQGIVELQKPAPTMTTTASELIPLAPSNTAADAPGAVELAPATATECPLPAEAATDIAIASLAPEAWSAVPPTNGGTPL